MTAEPPRRSIFASMFTRQDWDGATRYRWQKRPLTPEEEEQQRLEEAREKLAEEQRLAAEAAKRKKDAHNKLRIVIDFLDKEFTAPSTIKSAMPAVAQMAVLSQASKYLEQARQLDPSATVLRTLGENTHEWSIDMLATNILALEVDMHMGQAQAVFDMHTRMVAAGTSSKETEYREARDLAEHYGKARDAARKYLEYKPNDVAMLRLLARTQSHFGHDRSAKETLEKALALDPDDIETIKALDGYR